MTLTEEVMQAVFAAPDERKIIALKALKGEMPLAVARPVNGPLLLGMSAGAKLLGVSRATLWRVVRAGKIQKVELFPGSFRVRREDLETLAAANGPVGRGGKRGASCADASGRVVNVRGAV